MSSSTVIEGLLDLLLSPALWLGVVLALLYGAFFFGWRGGGVRQLGRDLVTGLLGFGIGQLGGALAGISLLRLGQLQLLAATAGAFCALLLGRRFWRMAGG